MKFNKSLSINCIAWDEFRDLFLENYQIEDALTNDIYLSKYGSGLEKILFVPMGLEEEDNFHEDFIGYDDENDLFLIKKKLDYKALKTADIDQFLRMVATAFYEEIDQIQLPDFDTAQFKKDVEALFLERGWLQGEATGA